MATLKNRARTLVAGISKYCSSENNELNACYSITDDVSSHELINAQIRRHPKRSFSARTY